MFIPFLAIPTILFNTPNVEYHGNLFPPEGEFLPEIAGTLINIDPNFYTSAAEAQIHIIGKKENRIQAKQIIMNKLSEWLKQHHSPNNFPNNNLNNINNDKDISTTTSKDNEEEVKNSSENIIDKPFIPKQFSAQFADQFSNFSAHVSSLSVDEYMSRLKQDLIDTNNNLKELNNLKDLNTNNGELEKEKELSPRSLLFDENNNIAEILDCGIKMLISSESANYFESIFNSSCNDNILQYIHKLTGCYIQILPNKNIISKSFETNKISIIGSSLTAIIKSQELLLDFIQVYKRKFKNQICYYYVFCFSIFCFLNPLIN